VQGAEKRGEREDKEGRVGKQGKETGGEKPGKGGPGCRRRTC